MAYPLVQFVDGPSSTAVLRYDFNARDASTRTHPLGADGLDLGVPSFSGEPGGVGVDYGYRQIRLTQRIEGTRAVALAKMSLLARELLRSTNWLRVQWAAGAPSVYFKTFRAEPGGVNLEHADTAGAWDITVPLVAEGFAYGPRETIPQVQIVQSPADLTSPTRYAMRYVLPAIKGDAPTPLRVTVTAAAAATATKGSELLLGCVAGSASMSDPVVDIGTGDGFTAGAGTSAPVVDAAYFDGEYRTVTVSAGSNFIERLTGSIPTVPPGRYKVLLRIEADGVASVAKPFIFAWANKSGFSGVTTTYGPSKTVTVNPELTAVVMLWRGWVDLGEFQFPYGVTLDKNLTDAPTGTVPTTPFSLKIGTADSSAGTVRIDSIKLIPVEGERVDRATFLSVASAYYPLGAVSRPSIFDGDTESIVAKNVGGTAYFESKPLCRGGFPVADPASPQNLLVYMALDHGDDVAANQTTSVTVKDSQSAIDVSYHPRYLHLGDGT